ncbi:MAG: hypothetical protein SLAVMIC_00633 [uncultured marine phage]|uniref:Phage protein n=1 Tax=uncultured marine phage TaxID=707152 RepID=A0A8D9CCJ5_9VIRU|nr:MAG: hypothetical protein SLAVMIC_00633 [uncultured marine phage]
MKFYSVIITPYGEFKGETLEGTKEQYNGLLEVTKHFYEQEVYFHYLEDETFFVMGKNLIADSIVMIKVVEDSINNNSVIPNIPNIDLDSMDGSH